MGETYFHASQIAIRHMSDHINSRSLHHLVGFAIMVAVAAVSAIGMTIWGLRDDGIAAATRDVGNIATILAEQTAQSVRAIDQTLIALEARVIAIHKAAPERFDDEIRSADVHRAMTSQLARLPQADVVTIVNRDGHFVNTTRGWPAPSLDISAIETFTFVKADRSRGLLVSLPIVTRTTGEIIVYFTRRIESPAGEFLGAVYVGVPITYFNHVYSSISSLPDQSFLFLRSDGTVLVRYPDSRERAGEKMPRSSPWYEMVAQGGGFYRSGGVFDNLARHVAVRKVAGFPLVVNVAVTETAALSVWRRRATMIAAGTVLTLMCVSLLLWALVAQFRKLVASQASLAERESKLSEKSRELERANRTIDAALNNMSQGLSMIDQEGRFVIWNERYIRIYDMPPDLVRPGASLVDVLAYRKRVGDFGEDPEAFLAALRDRMAKGERCQTRAQLADGRVISIVNEPMAEGGWVATHEDITERQHSQERIARMARHDALTDLANRMLFRERMDEAFSRHQATGKEYTIFIFDLDLFKAVNDSLGHPAGDALLKAVARRLQESTRESDTVGRLGGDEFAILQHADGQQRERAIGLAQRLLQVVGAPYEIDGHRVVIGISIGIAMAPQDGTDSAYLMRNADLALYRAKADGRNTFRFFEPAMDEDLRLRRTLEIDLHNAVANREFEAYYQPLVDLGTGCVCAIEALIRWRHPSRGMILPDRFIPVAEECGLITVIGQWVLRRACADAATWPAHIRVAVNLSPVQFRNSDLLEIVSAALADSGLAPERLELEITESVLLQKNVRDLEILNRIKSLGVSVVLDDFGTGYSSLSYLRQFPFDKIKIDRSFVQEMPHRSDCAAIVCAITSLGRELEMATTAEGVETEEQLELVRAAGCRQAQGFLLGRPCPASELKFAIGQVLLPPMAAAG
jgi:diguanylate cyclase (GGDEF)-like protein